MGMRYVQLTALFTTLLLSCVARGEIPALLADAIAKEQESEGKWAYTEEEITRSPKGAVKNTVVFRYDPSKPYAEQYTPLSSNGKPPSKKIMKEYRERGEAEAAARQKLYEQRAAGKDEAPRIELGNTTGLLSLATATLQQEDERSATYAIPVENEKTGQRMEAIHVRIRVNKQSRGLENIQLGIKGPFRVKLIAKVQSVTIAADYQPVGAGHPPQVYAVTVDAAVSVFFKNVGERIEVRRSGFERVKPYDERFKVKMGPLKAIGF